MFGREEHIERDFLFYALEPFLEISFPVTGNWDFRESLGEILGMRKVCLLRRRPTRNSLGCISSTHTHTGDLLSPRIIWGWSQKQRRMDSTKY